MTSEDINVTIADSETIAVAISESAITGSFLSLDDTPDSYSGKGGYFVKVNSGATGLEFSTETTSWGEITGTLSNQTDLQTALNLKYNAASFNTDWDARFATKTTTNLSEGTNLYYTDERVDDRVSSLIQNGTGLTWTYSDLGNTLTGNVSLSSFSTTNLAEGTNLYYTEDRVNANSNVSANTSARHNAVTVNDSTTVNFTLIGQSITADVQTLGIHNFKNDKVYLSEDELTYIWKNPSTGNIELWKDGGIIVEW